MKRLTIIFGIVCLCLPALGQGLAFDILELKESNDTLLFRYNALVTPAPSEPGRFCTSLRCWRATALSCHCRV